MTRATIRSLQLVCMGGHDTGATGRSPGRAGGSARRASGLVSSLPSTAQLLTSAYYHQVSETGESGRIGGKGRQQCTCRGGIYAARLPASNGVA